MGLPETALSAATRLINELNPSTRGEQRWMTDEIRKQLESLKADLVAEAKRVLGEDVQAVDSALPDNARHSYEWAMAHVERVLSGGAASLVEPSIPVGSQPAPEQPKRTQPKK